MSMTLNVLVAVVFVATLPEQGSPAEAPWVLSLCLWTRMNAYYEAKK